MSALRVSVAMASPPRSAAGTGPERTEEVLAGRPGRSLEIGRGTRERVNGTEGVTCALEGEKTGGTDRGADEGLGLRERHGLVGETVDDEPRDPDPPRGGKEVEPREVCEDVLEVVESICPCTQDRLDAVAELAGEVDAVVIVGGRNSANTARLLAAAREIAKSRCTAAHKGHGQVPAGCRSPCPQPLH